MSYFKQGLLFLAMLCLSACGRQMVEFGAEDAGAVRPTIIAMRPMNNATGVELNAIVTATFNQAMGAASINTTTFVLKQGGASIPGAVTFDAATKTASFTPDAPLMPGLVYAATVTAGAKGGSGLSLASDNTWTFTTKDDTVAAPTVIATTPLDKAIDVPDSTALTATFSRAMDATTITALTFSVQQAGKAVAGTVTLDGATNTAAFTPTLPLELGLVYTATLTTGAKDLSGTALAANFVWTFTTALVSAAPTVTATSPVNLAVDVPINSEVSATFSEAMDPASLTTTTFTVKQGGNSVAGAVTLNVATNTATFKPTAPLTLGLVYTATISTAAKDAGGTALAATFTWTFTTAPNNEPPMITIASPANLGVDVPSNSKVTATFSKAMDPATLTTTTFTVKQGVTAVAGTVTLNGATNTATFTPTLPLALGLVYTATLTADAKDLGGTALAANFVWTFTTAANSAAPMVTAISPANLGVDVPINSKVMATFSKAMDPSSLTETTFTVKQGVISIAGALTLNVATNTATFTPTVPLTFGRVYTATISTEAKDLGGTALAADFTWTFTTAANSAAPMVTATSPVDLATNVPINSKVTATFSMAMDAATLTATTFTVKQGVTAIAGVVTLNNATNTAIFTPTAPFGLGLVYTAMITTGAKDLGGTALAANFTWTFTSAANGAAPTVTATSPVDLATNVPINSKVSATFSKAMDAGTLTATTFTIKQGVTAVAGAVTLNGATNTATFTPAAPLGLGLVYTATITTGAKDLGGTALAANFTWTFTSAANSAAPMVTATSPVNLATNVPSNSKVTATFSKAMDATTLTATTFTVKQGVTSVAGVVTLNDATNTATFTPAASLALGLVYTATISTEAKDLGGTALAANYTWTFTSLAAPAVTNTSPAHLGINVPINSKVMATFSKAMDSATITATTFTVKQGVTPVVGTVALNGGTNTAIFTPSAPLAVGLIYTATITTGAKDTGGTPLAADFSWSFTTAPTAAAPMILSTRPIDLATNVSVNSKPTATFSAAMDPTTINNLTFTVKQGLVDVTGVVTLNVLTNTATFTPLSPLGIGLTYTATVTTGATDLGGAPLAANQTWTFSTGACSQAPIVLGAASGFAVLAGSTVTNTGLTMIQGDMGVSPGTAIAGFPPGVIVGAIHAGDPTAAQGIAALTIAYNDAAGRTLCPVTVAGNLGGQTLTPGLYKSTGSLAVSSGDLTLDAEGDGNAIFIFQIASTLTTTAARKVLLTNGADAANIFWQVGTSATLGTTSVFEGTIMADQAITLETGATLNGRALARITAIALDTNSIVKP